MTLKSGSTGRAAQRSGAAVEESAQAVFRRGSWNVQIVCVAAGLSGHGRAGRRAVRLPLMTFPGFQVRGQGRRDSFRPVGWFPVLVFAFVVPPGR